MFQLFEYSRVSSEMSDPKSWYNVRNDSCLDLKCKICSLEMVEGLVQCLYCHQRLHEKCADTWFSSGNAKKCVYCTSDCWTAYGKTTWSDCIVCKQATSPGDFRCQMCDSITHMKCQGDSKRCKKCHHVDLNLCLLHIF